MKKTRLMRFVAFVLSVIMVLENPMTALADNGAQTSANHESEGAAISTENESSDADILEILSDEESGNDDKVIEDAVEKALAEEETQEAFEVETEEAEKNSDEEDAGQTEGTAELYLTKELVGERTENSLTYERSDHSITTFIYSDAVSYQSDNDEWRLIDNRLHYVEEIKDDTADSGITDTTEKSDSDDKTVDTDGTKSVADNEEEIDFAGYTNTDAPFDVRFAEEADENRIFALQDGNNKILLAYVPTSKSANTVDSAKTKDSTDDLVKAGNAAADGQEDITTVTAETENKTVETISDSSEKMDIQKESGDVIHDTDVETEENRSQDEVESLMAKADDEESAEDAEALTAAAAGTTGAETSTTITDSQNNLTESTEAAQIVEENASIETVSQEEVADSSKADNAAVEDKKEDTGKWTRKITLIDPDKTLSPDKIALANSTDSIDALGASADSSGTDTEGGATDNISIEEKSEELFPDLPKAQTILYFDIEPGVDLRYELISDGIKETIILQNAAVSSEYMFKLDIGGLATKKTQDGGIYLCDESGQPVFEIPAPIVTDAEGADDCEASYEVKKDAEGKLYLTVSIDEEWLKAVNRAFPVEIDPTIKRYRRYKSFSNLGDFISVCSDGTKDSEKLQVGRTTKNKKNVTYRTFMNPKLPDIDTGSVVTEAKMRISAGSASQVFYCVPVPSDWSVDKISSSKLPVNKNDLKNVSDFGKNNTVVLDITKDVKEVKAGRKAANGWCLVSSDESAKGVRTLSPYKGTDKPFLEITYRDFTGTENYYSAHTQSAGSAGTGSINDYTGRLSFAHTDATSVGERMTLSVAHVYDIAYGERSGEEKWLTATNNTSAYGAHFRLSTDVRLLVPVGETDVKTYPYVYIDSDGTKHYFKKANVTYYVNGAKKEASKSNSNYPAAKDEDGLGLFVVPVTSKNLSGTYPLKIVNKGGSISMYFDKNGYLRMITDSNQRADTNNSEKKDRNAIVIDYDPGKNGSSTEHSELEKIQSSVGGYYNKDLTQDEMIDKALEFIADIESFERESLNVSVRYKIALNLQEAKDSLQKIPDGDKESNYKSDFKSAADSIKKALGETFDAVTYVPAKVTDAAGISADLNYDYDGRLVSMSDPYEGGALITYSYDDNGNLVRIDHPNGTYGLYTYDKDGHLIRAVDESGYRMDYVYGENKVKTGNKTETVITDQVVKFTEYVGKKAGQTVLVNYDEFNETAYTYSGLDEKINTKDDIENVYCFDHKGRTISTYSRKKKTKVVIGSSVKSYTDEDSDDTSSANKIKESAATGSQVINLLTDSSFEKETAKNGTPAWDTFLTDSSKGNSVSRNDKQKYMGAKSGYVKLSTEGSKNEGGFTQTITAPASGIYTASVYIHTKGLSSGTRAAIKLSTKKNISESGDNKDSEEESDEDIDAGEDEDAEDEGDDAFMEEPDDADEYAGEDAGDEISEEGIVDADSQPDINNGWKRIEANIKASKGESITLTLSLSGTSGEAWFDCAQIEKGTLSNQYNMLPNGGFEAGFKENASLSGLPSGWAYGAEAVKATDTATDDDAGFPDDDEEAEEAESDDEADAAAVRIVNVKTVGDTVIEGSNVLMISGNPIKRRSVIINPNFGSEKASYTFSCYVKADCAPVTGKRKCGIYVRGDKASYNEDNATGKYISISGTSAAYTKINTQTDGWQFVTVSLPVKNWKGKLIEIRFDYEVGNLYIDGCMLTKNEVKTKTYTAGGKLKTEQKGERTTTYATDGRDRRKKETTAGGATTNYTYDSVTNDTKSEKHTFKQSGGSKTLTTKYTYDKYGNTTEVTESGTSISKKIVTETEYDDDGRFAITDIDSRGYSTSAVFDENNGQVISSVDAKNIETSYTYDVFHQPTGVSSAGNSVTYTYNSKMHDQLKNIKTGEGKESETYSFTYDDYGNTKSVTRAAKNKKLVSYAYMANNGKLKSITYGNWGIDVNGNGNKNKLTYRYNDLEQVISESWGGKDITRYEYDNRGNKARITDNLSGLKYRYYYDDQNRVITAEITKTEGKTSKELISFQSIYDKAGRQSVFAYYTGGRSYRTEYGYTTDDKVSAAVLPSGGVFGRTYDAFDRVTKVVFTPQKKAGTNEDKSRGGGAAVTSSYSYLETDRNQENGSTTSGNKTTYKFTTRLLSKLETRVGKDKKALPAISETLSYDELGRISGWGIENSAYATLSALDKTGDILYKYDDLGRLVRTEDSATGREWEYTYDAIGNITSSTYIDEKGTKHSDTYKYDKDNLTKFNGEKVDGYSGGNPKTYLGYTLKWMHGRQLVSATPTKKKTLADSNAQTVTYTYAYDGSRLSKTVGKTNKSAGTTTEYILNGSTILAQNTTYANGETETLNFYYSSDGKLIEIGYLKYDSANGSSGLKDATENHYSVIRNAMGDVAALYTADGTLVGTYEYDPYGLPLDTTANTAYIDADGILEKNPFRYRGYYYDNETGWYYLQSRYYDPEVKRFINADSVDLLIANCANLMQYNLFMYCYGDPVNEVDPSGHFALTAFAIVGLIVAGTIVGGAVGAYTSAAAGTDIKEGVFEGALLGGVGTACAIFLPSLFAVAFPEIAGSTALITAGTFEATSMIGMGVDYGFQYCFHGDENNGYLDAERAENAGFFTGLGTLIPGIQCGEYTAFATGLVWNEGSVLIGCAESIYTYLCGE